MLRLLSQHPEFDIIDEEDGKKIVNNVFGDKKTEVVAEGSALGGVDLSCIVAKVLPIITPIVLPYLASQFPGCKKEAPASTPEPASTSAGIGDLLGGLLGSQQRK